MIIHISDDLDLGKIADSGQCFRVRRFENGMYRFITKNHILYISEVGGGDYSVSCSDEEWQDVWTAYFNLHRCYRQLRESIPVSDCFLLKAAEEGCGIRILVQDHWETLVSFIISQRKSIPAIRNSIELLCSMFGTAVTTPYETIYTFPSAEDMRGITPEDLARCKVGYRAGYIRDAVDRVLEHSLALDEMEMLPDAELFNRLIQVRGVGKKVADCVELFSYGRTSLAPVDTWIRKVMDTYYDGQDPFGAYGDGAGIMQQYVFYYAQMHKEEFRTDVS